MINHTNDKIFEFSVCSLGVRITALHSGTAHVVVRQPP